MGIRGDDVPDGVRIDNVRNCPYIPGMRTKRRAQAMSSIRELATLTSKGQITLPKAIRQALGVTTGGKVAFELRGGEVVVTRGEAEHEDPAIGAFLGLLEADIRKGRNVQALPEELARAMLANVGRAENLDEEIEGEVAL
jgi:antitoxin PrlF